MTRCRISPLEIFRMKGRSSVGHQYTRIQHAVEELNRQNRYGSCVVIPSWWIEIRKIKVKLKPHRQWRSSSFQESKKVRVSRDLWPWPWHWAHPGCMLTWSPSCESLVAIRSFAWKKKRFAQKFTDGRYHSISQTTDASPLYKLILGMS